MAEERLIDEDKDRKYKIRKNADGEDELYIDETEEPEESEETVFYAPDDDSEEDIMTPEQIAARERLEQEEKERREKLLKECAENAQTALNGGDYHAALQYVEQAEEAETTDGEICALKLIALSCNFTDFSRSDELDEAADGVAEHTAAERKATLKELAKPVSERISALEGEIKTLEVENDNGKAERRVVFKARRKSALIGFGCAFLPFVVFLILAIVYGSAIHAVKDSYTNMYLTIIFGALAGVMFIALLIAINKLWTALRNVRLNEKDTSTKLGRELIEKRAECELLNKIYNSFNV